MNDVKICEDYKSYDSKPKGDEAGRISKWIAGQTRLLNSENIRAFIDDVALYGHTFCPATFKDEKRSKVNFEQQQLFALDFDGGVSFGDVKARTEKYELPMLFAYDTFSSEGHNKFRIVFLNDVSVTHRKAAEAMQQALGTIFPEADTSCVKDVSKMYYGGKELIFCDNTVPTINIEALFRNLTNCLEDRHGPTNIKRHTERFSRETGLALNAKGKPDIIVTDDISSCTNLLGSKNRTETPSANTDDNNSPVPILYENVYIKGAGEKLSRYYIMNFGGGGTNQPSVGRRKPGNHAGYRSDELTGIGTRCRLYCEFETGSRRLSYSELFGIATNLVNIESGADRFKEVLRSNSYYDGRPEKYHKWEQNIRYIKDYNPYSCDGFCPYKDECSHGRNILSRLKRGTVDRIIGCTEDFVSVKELQEDVYRAIRKAHKSADNKINIVRAMTGAGKTHAYLKLMSEYPADRFLIAASSNILKDEIFNKAVGLKLHVIKTPSLEAENVRTAIPPKVRKHIQRLYKTGQHRSVHPFICETLEKKSIPRLREYMEDREKLKIFSGSVITTHRYLLNMDRKRLKEYDAVIIDEDIILKSVISNQCAITTSDLKKLLKIVTGKKLLKIVTDKQMIKKVTQLIKKVKQLIKRSSTQTYIELNSFDYGTDDYDDISMPLDIPSFCLTERFYVRRTSEEKNLKEDTIVFIKPASLKEHVKYIVVSATAEEKIYRRFFGDANVSFRECEKAKYQGNLQQYPGKSMSRTSIDNDPGIIERLMKRFDIDAGRVITFMKYGIGALHYGNTEGSNTMEGQDILVIGTPYHAEFLYKLVAFTFGFDFDTDAEMKPQFISRNGFSFRFNTYEDENLRAIQLWMIESELEQAIGRARLLRHDCNVHLFSNFPLSQAEMVAEFDYG